MADQAVLLARGPWEPGRVEATWRDDPWQPPAEVERRADEAVDELRERGSPAHDGEAARLAGW
ncbi:MAG: 8-oxo-dGTP diphosphatase, partial [Thermoleophilaceae bacterium]|nr:8-oxo-dGTP diphosphatase [Thermoleophilaceae bacterium]